MSWGLAADWFAVAGTAFLTFGTGAQAWANLAEFRILRHEIGLEAIYGHHRSRYDRALASFPSSPSLRLMLWMTVRLWFADKMRGVIILFRLPEALGRIRADGGDDAVQLARFMRLAEVWTILMIGSALALAAAAIQLALA